MSKQQSWSDKEIEILKLYKTKTVYEIMTLLPHRTKTSIQHKAERLGFKKGTIQSNLNRARHFRVPEVIQSKELAWLLGAYTGDGFVTGKFATLGITSIDYELCSYFRWCASIAYEDNTILNIDITEKDQTHNKYSQKTGYVFRCGGAELGRWMKHITKNKSIIPNEIKFANKEIKISYLAALFDTEGCIYSGKKATTFSAYIGMGEYQKDFMHELDIMFNSLGIKTQAIRFESGSRSWRIGFNLKSFVTSDILNYLIIDRKKETFKSYIETVLKNN